jgi:hypothetical protein
VRQKTESHTRYSCVPEPYGGPDDLEGRETENFRRSVISFQPAPTATTDQCPAAQVQSIGPGWPTPAPLQAGAVNV